MSLQSDIKNLLETYDKTKAQKILEVKEEVEQLIENKIPFKKQIELLVKNNIVDKISLSEYKKILVSYFDYVPNSKVKIEASNREKKVSILPNKDKIVKEEIANPARSAKDVLSQDVNLLG